MNRKKSKIKRRDTINKKLIIQISLSILLVLIILVSKQFDNTITQKILEITDEKTSENINLGSIGESIKKAASSGVEKFSALFGKDTEYAAPVNGTIYNKYGISDGNDPYYNHGIDILSNTETVKSISDGNVIIVDENDKLSKYIVVETKNRKIIYGRLDQLFVQVGDKLDKGTIIGSLDSENRILHLEIWEDGESLNPNKLLNVDE